jgi:hypothetical protein
LQVVHLNGTMADIPAAVTFSASQYARRLAQPDHLYQQLVADLLSRPVVFVGTNLDESPLWQSIELRRTKGPRGARELRPRSYLVTPQLDRARQARLAGFNIMWLKMTAQEFAEQVLAQLREASEAGLSLLKGSLSSGTVGARIAEVADLSTSPSQSSEFLLGEEPVWADVQAGRAIARECDAQFEVALRDRLETEGIRGAIIVTGTAGSGKSTSLMRLALKASAEGRRVGWIDRHSDPSIRSVISAMELDDSPEILAIDEAEAFGTGLSAMLRELSMLERNPLIIVSMRSGTLDRVLNPAALGDVPIREITVPHLADSDIDSLLDTLDRENRLGVLKGMSREQQRLAFRDQAGRQLLVAMISATSGVRFEEKIADEFDQLGDDAQRVYATVALATTFRYGLSRQDLLIALNDSTNEALNTIDALLSRHILAEHPSHSGMIQTRHRVIAERLRDELQRRGQLTEAIFGLGFLAATQCHPGTPRRGLALRLLRAVINHDFLYRTLGLDASKTFYQQLEGLLASDSHYWLQRGSLEVEFGDLHLAENFLGQARGLAPDDLLVDNEWAYLLFRKALSNPAAASAPELVREATEICEAIIRDPRCQPHPFHVLGAQGLAWSRRGLSDREERARYLRAITSRVEDGRARFPNNRELRKLHEDLRREYLLLAVPSHTEP